MKKWIASWSGAIQNFPGLQSLITGAENLEHEAVEQVEHIEGAILAYFEKHPGKNGSISVEGHAEENGEHSCTLTIAAIPQAVEPEDITPAVHETAATQAPSDSPSPPSSAEGSGTPPANPTPPVAPTSPPAATPATPPAATTPGSSSAPPATSPPVATPPAS